MYNFTTWVFAESFDISKETINTYKLFKKKGKEKHAEAEMRLVPWPSRLSPLQVRKAARLGDLLVDCGESQVGSWLLLAAGGVSAEADRLATGLQHCKRRVADNLWDILQN